MDDSGGMTETLSACARDGVQTRLRCAECQAPICPDCYVRTPVGLRCPDCCAASGPPVRDVEEAGRRWAVPVAVAVVLAVGLIVAALAGGGGGGGQPALDLGEGGQSSRRGATVVAPPQGAVMGDRLATGDVPRGRWVLSARRGAPGICFTLGIEPGFAGEERCVPVPGGDQHVGFTTTSKLSTPAATGYLTVGVVSERTERILVAPAEGGSSEVPVIGADRNLGARIFVVYAASPVTTFTALAGDGSPLGRTTSSYTGP